VEEAEVAGVLANLRSTRSRRGANTGGDHHGGYHCLPLSPLGRFGPQIPFEIAIWGYRMGIYIYWYNPFSDPHQLFATEASRMHYAPSHNRPGAKAERSERNRVPRKSKP
jgi:hypothetical protein